MNYTPNYHLGLPIPAERYDVSIVNANNAVIDGQLRTNADAITNHKNDHNNPHAVTAAQVGLGNVDNTADANKPVSTAQAQYVTQAVSAESTRATGAENTLSGQISAEVTRATGAESTLADDLSTETARATGIENDLAVMISTETTRAQGAESDLRDYVDEKLSVTYKASGSVFFADLPALAASREGHVYNIKDDFTTTADFVEGAGKDYPAGTNVAIIEKDEESYEEATVEETDNPSEMGLYELDGSDYVLTADTSPVEEKTYYELTTTPSYFYDVLAGFIDTSDFITDIDYATAQTAGIVKPDGTTVTVDENGVVSAIGGGDVSSEEMADVVNILGAKNLCSFPYVEPGETTINGVKFIITSTYSIHVHGTANADIEYVLHDSWNGTKNELIIPNGDYILSGCPEGGGLDSYYLTVYSYPKRFYGNDTGEGLEFTANGDSYRIPSSVRLGVSIVIKAGTQIGDIYFNPMIRPKSITDDAYTVYAKRNKELNALTPILNNLGAKNLIKPFIGTQTIDGVTVTVNSDGVVTINGTRNSEAVFTRITVGKAESLEPGAMYTLSGVPYSVAGDNMNCEVEARYDDSAYGRIYSEAGRGTTFHLFKQKDSLLIAVYLSGNKTFDNFVVKPMLRYGVIGDGTFVPYAKTNRQLTTQLYSGSEGTSFNFDFQNGQYGWNETDDKDPATFHPFGADDNFVGTMQEWEDEENKSKYKTVDIIDDADGFMIDTIPTHGSQNVITSGGTYNALKTKVDKSELTSISVTGDVNNTGSTIHENTYFYLNDELVKAKVDIANGAAFTLNTNYEETGDILNSINNDVDAVFLTSTTSTTPVSVSINISKYRLLLLRITNSASTVVYGSDLVPVDALKNGDVINFIRYFNVLSSNITGTLTYSSGNSFSASISNSSYVFEVYGIEALANGSSNAPSTSKADKTDLTSIIESGAIASQPIASGKYFYLNGVLARAKTDIASNASFSLNVNYEEVTAGALNDSKSYVGMIIHSTTLDTMAKVVAFYGGTTWIQHSGYFLRGATSDVVANSATKTGGNDNAIVPSHTHTMQLGGEHNHGSVPVSGVDMADGYSAYRAVKNVSMYTSISSADSAHTHAIDYAGEGATNKNIPNYKSVYIWERTV